MKTVLILINSSGGLYDFRGGLVGELLKTCRVVVSVPDEVKTEELKNLGCTVVHTPINRRGVNPSEDLKLIKAYKVLMKSEKPDLVLTYTIKPNIYGGMIAARLHIPYLVTVTGLGSTFQKKGLFLKLIIALYKKGLRKADCVFFQNRENMEIFENYGISGKMSRLVNGSGVDLDKHPFEPYSESEDVNFLYVGRIMREKGIAEYLKAAEALHSEQVHFKLLGYCDEDWQEELKKHQRAGNIEFLGFDPNVNSHLAASSALVLPTYHEGMSNVLMEASATGRPILASRISGCIEILEDGITGFSFEKENVASLIEALKRFLDLSVSERALMGKRGRDRMEAVFDRKKVTADYMQVIRNIMTG